jgi:hypothetical protein
MTAATMALRLTSPVPTWKEDYNRNRPHSSLGNITPSEFAMKVAMENRSREARLKTQTLLKTGGKLGLRSSAIKARVGATLTRIIADAGYKGHNAPKSHRFKVCTAGQKRGMTDQIKREMRRRSAVEPVIGHLKDDHRMGRNHLAHAQGDAINAVLAATGYNFRRILAWITFLCAFICMVLAPPNSSNHHELPPISTGQSA